MRKLALAGVIKLVVPLGTHGMVADAFDEKSAPALGAVGTPTISANDFTAPALLRTQLARLLGRYQIMVAQRTLPRLVRIGGSD